MTPLTPLDVAIQTTDEFLAKLGEDLSDLPDTETARVHETLEILDNTVEAFLVEDDTKSRYLALAGEVNHLFKATLSTSAKIKLSAK